MNIQAKTPKNANMQFLTFGIKSKIEAIGLNPVGKCRMLYINKLILADNKMNTPAINPKNAFLIYIRNKHIKYIF